MKMKNNLIGAILAIPVSVLTHKHRTMTDFHPLKSVGHSGVSYINQVRKPLVCIYARDNKAEGLEDSDKLLTYMQSAVGNLWPLETAG